MLPPAFRKLWLLAALNVVAVGLALGAFTCAACPDLESAGEIRGWCGAVASVVGAFWAWLIRQPWYVGEPGIRRGWVASLPLAMAIALLALLLQLPLLAFLALPVPLMLAAYFGLKGWVVTMLCLGLPIARAQRLAERGLAGEEKGEALIGAACVVLSVVAVVVAVGDAHMQWHEELLARRATIALAALATLSGGIATVLSLVRGASRRRFVIRAATGRVPGLRVDPREAGRVLVRIGGGARVGVEGYRTAALDEELFELDERGEAQWPSPLAEAARH